MGIPGRIRRQRGRHSLVDGIPFPVPINTEQSPAIMAVFPIDYDRARALLPGNEIHPMRLWKKALLVVAIINYEVTDIGKYIEFSVGIACTHGKKPAPRLLPGLFMRHYGTGQYVVDLPVSSEISVKGGKGIWGMPKHQGNLDFKISENTVSSQYELDGRLVMKLTIDRPKSAWLPLNVRGVNYCGFRGLLMKSTVYFKAKAGFSLFKKGAASLVLGDHPRAQLIKDLDVGNEPIATVFIPEVNGVLDDHFEGWFLTFPRAPDAAPEGFESVINLGHSQEWLAAPSIEVDEPGRDGAGD